jgi:hypothetical protein
MDASSPRTSGRLRPDGVFARTLVKMANVHAAKSDMATMPDILPLHLTGCS